LFAPAHGLAPHAHTHVHGERRAATVTGSHPSQYQGLFHLSSNLRLVCHSPVMAFSALAHSLHPSSCAKAGSLREPATVVSR
jgi:hypothetical protein